MCSLRKEAPFSLPKTSSSVASDKKEKCRQDWKHKSGLKKVENELEDGEIGGKRQYEHRAESGGSPHSHRHRRSPRKKKSLDKEEKSPEECQNYRKHASDFKEIEDELEEGEIGEERQDEHRADSGNSSHSHRRRRRSRKKHSLDKEEKSPVKKVSRTETVSVSISSPHHDSAFKDCLHSGERDTGIQEVEGSKHPSTSKNAERNGDCFTDSDTNWKEYATNKKANSSPQKYRKELETNKQKDKEVDVIDLTENDEAEVRNSSQFSIQKSKEDHQWQQCKIMNKTQTSKNDSKNWAEGKKHHGEGVSSFPHASKQSLSGFQGYRNSQRVQQSMRQGCYTAFQNMCQVDPAIVSYSMPGMAQMPCPIQSTVSSLANQVIQQQYRSMYYDPAIISWRGPPLAAPFSWNCRLPPTNCWNSSGRFQWNVPRWNMPSTSSYSTKASSGGVAGSNNETQWKEKKSFIRKGGAWPNHQQNSKGSPQHSGESCPEMEVTPRHWQVVQEHADKGGSMEFTVMSYNILAQDLLEQHRHLYRLCDTDDLEWDTRRRVLTHQILTHNADILCLQEMQENHWNSKFGKDLCSHGYSGHYIKRAGSKPDGCAILFKKDKFQLVKKKCVNFLRGGLLDRDNVGMILLLQPNQGTCKGGMKRICVATTHLLFNPKRGDVKLAQLMLLLAEIDKMAFRNPEEEGVMAGVDKNGKGGAEGSMSPAQLTAEQTRVGDIGATAKCKGKNSPEIIDLSTDQNTDAGNDHDKGSKEVLLTDHYYPIIMCGDFNTEPECDLYNFITSGKLEYQGCVSRLLAGQKEGMHGWNNSVIPKNILPKDLGISERCQYIQEVHARLNKIRQKGSASKISIPQVKMNTGHAFHSHSFKSVYSSVLRKTTRGDQNVMGVSTQHMSASCIVDYIFYSSASPSRQSQPDLIGKTNLDSQTLTNANESLELIARYCLLSKSEVEGTGFLPNSVLPSDHLCLIAKFLLK